MMPEGATRQAMVFWDAGNVLWPSFVWNKFNLLPSAWYNAVLWSWDENKADNTDVLGGAKLCLY